MSKVCNFIMNYNEFKNTFPKWKDICNEDVDLFVKDNAFQNTYLIKHNKILISQLDTFKIDLNTNPYHNFFF
jgi:hypothetical protein